MIFENINFDLENVPGKYKLTRQALGERLARLDNEYTTDNAAQNAIVSQLRLSIESIANSLKFMLNRIQLTNCNMFANAMPNNGIIEKLFDISQTLRAHAMPVKMSDIIQTLHDINSTAPEGTTISAAVKIYSYDIENSIHLSQIYDALRTIINARSTNVTTCMYVAIYDMTHKFYYTGMNWSDDIHEAALYGSKETAKQVITKEIDCETSKRVTTKIIRKTVTLEELLT